MKIKNLLFDQLAGNFIAIFIGFIFLSSSTYINGTYGVWQGPAPVMLGIFAMCFWVTRLHAYRESIRIKNRKRIDHLQRLVWRFVIACFVASAISYTAEGYNRHFSLMAGITVIYIGAI